MSCWAYKYVSVCCCKLIDKIYCLFLLWIYHRLGSSTVLVVSARNLYIFDHVGQVLFPELKCYPGAGPTQQSQNMDHYLGSTNIYDVSLGPAKKV